MKFGALLLLAAAFWGRVGAQLIQYRADVSWLPAFDSWQSGAVSYSGLLMMQGAVIIVQLVVLRAAARRALRGRRWLRWGLIGIGVVYFGFMLFRLVAGFTFLAGDSWFDAPLPSVFHMVLAAFVCLTGWFMAESRPRSDRIEARV